MLNVIVMSVVMLNVMAPMVEVSDTDKLFLHTLLSVMSYLL